MTEKTYLKRSDKTKRNKNFEASLAAFIRDLEKNKIEAHSLMVIQNGEVSFGTWAPPCGPDIPHVMFSVSKSFTSTAIGFAVDEGLLSLDTKLIDIFPEYRDEEVDENLEKLTIFHLLTMTAGKDGSLMADRTKDRWVRNFFQAKWLFEPGTSFKYINENTYMLSAALERVAGMTMTEYLTPRLYDPLGYGRVPFWESDPSGTQAGGWGLYITTEELAKLALCYKQGGVYEGKQVIPADWVYEATRKQVDTNRLGIDSSVGYGFCFWRNSVENSYRMDGMFSQFAFIFEDIDAILIVTASEVLEQKFRDCVWRHFPAAFFAENQPPENFEPYLPEDLELKTLEDLPAKKRSGYERVINGRVALTGRKRLLEAINFPLSMLPLAVVYMSADKAGNVDEISFEFEKDECLIGWTEGEEKNLVRCGMDGKPRLSKIHLAGMDFTAASTAAWQDEKTLSFWMRPVESICQRRIDFVFDGFDVEMYFTSSPSTRKMMMMLSGSVEEYMTNAVALRAMQGLMLNAHRILEPTLKGRLYKKDALPKK